MMTQANTRYFVEHKALPNTLYNNGGALLRALLNDEGKAMEKIYKHTSRAARLPRCRYGRADFALEFQEYINSGSTVFIVGIKMPQPERSRLCKAAYLCYSGENESSLYITSELREDGRYDLCVHTRNGERLSCSLICGDEFSAVAKTYWDFTLGGDKDLAPQLVVTLPRKSA